MEKNRSTLMYKPLVRCSDKSELPASQQKSTQAQGSLVTSTGNVRSVSLVQSLQALMPLPTVVALPLPNFDKIHFYTPPPPLSLQNEQPTTSAKKPAIPPSTSDITTPIRNKPSSPVAGSQEKMRQSAGKTKKTHCSIECRKSFAHEGQLGIHSNKHLQGEIKSRPFECKVCNKAFSVKGNLEAHMRIHTGEKPYKCSLCDKTFTHLGSLKHHTKMHTEGKPYACKCSVGFTTAEELRTHKATCVNNSQDKPSTSGSGR